jgi:hypothetical protein
MVVRSKDGKFPMVLDLPEQGVKETFREGSDIEKFLRDEVALWRKLVSDVSDLTLFGTNVPIVAGQQAASEAASWVAEAGQRTDSEAAYASALKRFAAERSVLLGGKLGAAILDRSGETSRQTAGVVWAAATMLGTSRLAQATNQRVTATELSAFSYGQFKLTNGLSRLRAERQNIERLVQELNDQIAKANADSAATSEMIKGATEELEGSVSRHKTATANLAAEGEEAIRSLIQSSKDQVTASVSETTQTLAETLRTSTEEIEEFKRKVRIDVGLEEPTNFWNDKANGHRWIAGGFGILFLVAVVAMVFWIDGYAVDLVADAVDRIVGERQAAALSLVPIAFITVPALAFAWVLRHLSRIIIQNLSLEADARLRGTITRTFKALAADRAMNDAELAIALQALFRPIDGKDHSEIAPPSLGDILRLGGDGKA